MGLDENMLKNIWISLFQDEIISKVANLNDELVGPFMLIERSFLAFKELGFNYVNCIEELKHLKEKLEHTSKQLRIVNEKLNETHKPCENCESLFKELTQAKKRAEDAENRVTQIAEILVFKSDDKKETKSSTRSSSISPKRKRNCVRDEEEDICISSQTVEIGVTRFSPNKVSSLDIAPKLSKNKFSPIKEMKKLSRSFDIENEFEHDISKSNLSEDVINQTKISPKKYKMSNKENNISPNLPNACDSLPKFSESCAPESDKIWCETSPVNNKNCKNIEDSPDSPIDIKAHFKEPLGNCRIKRIKYSKFQKVTKNLDSSYDIVLEKKIPKKKFKQLTLKMKGSNKKISELKNDEEQQSDIDDIILPSPDKSDENDEMKEFMKGLEGNTSTQLTQNNSCNKVLDKRKPTTPVKQPATTSKSKEILNNSYDVIKENIRKTPSPNYKYKGKTVRGKARAQLQGWDCEECKEYYEIACKNQSPSKVKSIMNLCSRHRSKHKVTRPPTPPGFWDIDIPDTPE